MNFVGESKAEAEPSGSKNDEAAEEPIDRRPLYARLKEQKDVKQLEYDEAHKLKNQFRGIDESEATFLQQCNRLKEEAEARRKKEEDDLLRQSKELPLASATEPTLDKPSRRPACKQVNKQASLITTGIIRKRTRTSSNDEDDDKVLAKNPKPLPETPSTGEAGTITSKPALVSCYDSSSGEEDAGDSLSKIPYLLQATQWQPALRIPIKEAVIDSQAADQMDQSQSSLTSTGSASSAASWYNSVPNTGVGARTGSRIYHQRNFNNWIKSQLIDEFIKRLREQGCPAATVLDLCCGKGGDLPKWKIGQIKEIVMTDIAEVALEHSRQRYAQVCDQIARSRRRPFKAHFIHADSSKVLLADRLPTGMKFDLCSCQFALHYSFESEQAARRLLWNATATLHPGGYFIGTIPDANMIVKLLRENNGLFENDVCRIEYADRDSIEDFANFKPPLFGAKLNFQLHECVNCPEFLAYFPLMERILVEECNMELVYTYSFPDAVDYYLARQPNDKAAEWLMKRMKALETYPPLPGTELIADEGEYQDAQQRVREMPQGDGDIRIGTLSNSEWEVVSMYKVFAFQKKKKEEGTRA